MLRIFLFAALSAFLSSSPAWALCTVYPHALGANTLAKAQDVMDNFSCAALTSGATLSATSLIGTTAFSNTSGNTITLDKPNGAAVAFQSSGIQKFLIEDDSASSSALGFYSWNGSSWTNLVNFKTNGNVGIGTTSPSYTLHVNGSVAGVSWTNLSDGRLKKNVREIRGALATILKLQGVSYSWRAPEERSVGKTLNLPVGELQLGFIAQDIKSVLPEAVSATKDRDAIMGVSESKVVPVLVEAVKELNAANSALKSQNDRQVKEIESLRTKFDALERRVNDRASQR